MATSARIQELILIYLSEGGPRSVQEIKNYLGNSELGEYTEGQFAGSINTLMRNNSIKKVDRGIYEIRHNEEGNTNMSTCFIVSPIGDDGSEVRKNADKLFKHIIKPVCDECGFDAIRVDQLNDATSITQTIIDKLETSELVIADISGHNPNVFYEMGFRARTNKPIIHLKTKGEKIPFDINTVRTFEYDLTDLDSVEEVKARLEQTIKSFDFTTLLNESADSAEEKNESGISVMPILYQILDAIAGLEKEVKNINSDTIKAVIDGMQNTQPQMSPETALQAQMLNSLMQNPDNLLKIMQIADKIPNSNTKLKR